MAETIFDLVEEEIPEGKEGYFELAKRAPAPKDNSFFSSVSDYAKTFLKGTTEGITRLGRAFGPLKDISGKGSPFYKPKETPEILEEQTQALDELLPTEEGFGQKSLRRGLREAPTMLAFPGSASLSTLTRTGAAGLAGQTAEELGAPEWAQTAAELSAFIGPDVTKKLLSSGKNKEIIDFGRKMGLTDEQITPLIQGDFKQKWLSKLSSKRGATQTALADTKTGLGEGYSALQSSPKASQAISEAASEKMSEALFNKLKAMPHDVRDKIRVDLNDLLDNRVTGASLMNFYADINHHLGGRTKQLSILKDPIKEAISSISPQLGKDFDMLNNLYSKYHTIASKLKPTLTSDIISAAEATGILGSLVTGHYPTLVSILGEKSAKKVAQQMLINPHLQQLSTKTIEALNQNKYGVVKKLTEAFSAQLKKSNPEAAMALDKISEEDIKQLLIRHQSEKAEPPKGQ